MFINVFMRNILVKISHKVYKYVKTIIMMSKSKKGVKGFIKEGESDAAISLGTEAWNVADGYTKIKILKNLILLDSYEDIATYGAEEMGDLDYMDANQIAQKREQALRRIVTTLKKLLGNVKFALKKEDKLHIELYLIKINLIEKYLDGIVAFEENHLTKETAIIINEEHFNICLNNLRKIKDDVNVPINNAGLIFRTSDEIDLEKIMKDIIEGG